MNSEDVKFLISAGMPSALILIGILINHSRLSNIRDLMDKRFDEVDKRFAETHRLILGRLRHIEERG